MEVRPMPFFQDFRDGFMTGEEFAIYRLQALSLSHESGRQGHFEKVVKTAKRVLVVNYYGSPKLNALFVLTAHITRAGEPREKEKEALAKYIRQIKLAEEEK